MTPVTGPEKDGPAPRRRPEGASNDLVAAVGKASEAFEFIERARGHLYSFHQLMGRADLLLGESAEMLEGCGLTDESDRVRTEIVGRNVLDGRWTFQIVEEFDHLYYGPVLDEMRRLEQELMGGFRHVYESEMKEQHRTPGRRNHEARPPSAHSPEVETT